MGEARTGLREARVATGLSQAELATVAGVSRQAVGAIESGRHRPGVDAALTLAAVVGRSVEELFAAPSAPAECGTVLATPAADGAAVLAARVGERLVHAPADEALAFEGWPRANAVLRGGRPVPLPECDLEGFVIVGCDPALGLASALLPASGPRRVIAVSGSTAAALDALGAGRAHAALVHGPAGRLAPPSGAMRLHLARWRVGVASRGRHARTVAELCARRARVVQREAGASSQKAFLGAVAAEGGSPPAGPVASGHLEVARRVANGATAGVTMEPAAISRRLAFSALEEHVAEVWIGAPWRDHPAVGPLAELLRSATFRARLALVGGYDLTDCGAESR